MKRVCVIGWPVDHSRSPLIHNYWLRLHDIDATYERVPVEPGLLPHFVSSLAHDQYVGCNVTLPHKEAVFKLVKIDDDTTQRLGVVNTIFLRNGVAYGTSTDGAGFLASLTAGAPDFSVRNERVVMLGAGGASLAIAGAVLGAGASEIAVANRSVGRTGTMRRKFGDRIRPVAWEDRSGSLSECALLINTTALGMTGQPPLTIDLAHLPMKSIVTDIVYTPLETAFLKQARQRGNVTVGGLGMLLHQAVGGFLLWFGVRPTVTPELYNLVAHDIEPDYRP